MSLASELKKGLGFLSSLFSTDSFSNPENPSISANIICYNNIKSIEACLKSLEGAVDEIVVVDGGSTDGTLEVLKKYNCKIIENKDWQGYSYQRNLCIKNSIGDWIIKLDSDEFLSEELRANLKKICSSKIYSAYRIHSRWIQAIEANQEVRYIDRSEHKGRYKSLVRIFRARRNGKKAIEYAGEIHEWVAGLEDLRVKKMPHHKNYVYHADVAINSFDERFEKVKKREEQFNGSGHPEEYTPELYDIKTSVMPAKDQSYLEYLQLREDALK